MTTTEAKLKERLKELTCLYEVSSIIVNSDYEELETSLRAIAHCLKRAWQYSDRAAVLLHSGPYRLGTPGFKEDMVCLTSTIKVFNVPDGAITVGYPSDTHSKNDFLEEEQKLLDNVGIAVGNLLERKQIRDSEAAIKRQMERADRLHILGEITAGIAHELNTPLANILGFAELLRDKVKNEENVRDLKKIMDNAIFSREIVKKLMFFACEMPQEMQTISLNPIVENALKLLKPALQQKNIVLHSHLAPQTLSLRADTVQVTQVLFNLIMNAIHFSPQGGEITVTTKKMTKGVEITISDQGPGISKENEDKVFEPFFTTKPLKEGSGLGLSVVHGIISSHKGHIAHAPNRPKGTIFTVYFPKS
ncbi:sensor histidine kinase [Maribacter sp. 2307ULW6-5]|uniref:sensor histidine kinase n=1 Tax=Maribacter sp. 2307ULW6-5 TaxID=3386275 RepID=UPI0039BD280F